VTTAWPPNYSTVHTGQMTTLCDGDLLTYVYLARPSENRGSCV